MCLRCKDIFYQNKTIRSVAFKQVKNMIRDLTKKISVVIHIFTSPYFHFRTHFHFFAVRNLFKMGLPHFFFGDLCIHNIKLIIYLYVPCSMYFALMIPEISILNENRVWK
jgi:hypothetical protein